MLIQLTHRTNRPMLVNTDDIVYVMPQGDQGSRITLRQDLVTIECSEKPDEIWERIAAAQAESVRGERFRRAEPGQEAAKK